MSAGVPSTPLGRTGLTVSRLCLGTMTFGRQCDETVSHAVLDRAFDAGIRFLDTADVYPFSGSDFSLVGRSEEIIGRWLRGRREDVVVATKFGARVGPSPIDGGASRAHVTRAVEESLRRLGTDRIDLYQLHVPDPRTPIEETLTALADLVEAGKVRAVGCSNLSADQLADALAVAWEVELPRFDVVQLRYNLLYRQPEQRLLGLCADEALAVLPYNPLAGGLLTGKYAVDAAPPEGSRFAHPEAGAISRDRYWHQDERSGAAAVASVATAAGIAPGTLAIGWLLAQPAVTAPLVGASSPDQLSIALDALQTPLPDDVLRALDAATTRFRTGDAAL